MLFRLTIFLFLTVSSLSAGDLYLNIIWHQHQPLYLDPETDQLQGPWVRTHATKDYYDMAAMHRNFPEIHATINLTSSLLFQLREYYVNRIGSFIGTEPSREGDDAPKRLSFDSEGFLKKWGGKTDPWIDLALKPTAEFTQADIDKLVNEPWNAFGISEIQIARFPEYQALRDKPREELTTEDYTAIKAWFFLAHFDPDFLRGKSPMNIDLSDLLREDEGKFYLNRPLTDDDAVRLVVDAVRIAQEVIPAHRRLLYDTRTHRGQLEIITTPYYHPILPLIIDSDIAKISQPNSSLPARFAYPLDGTAQIVKGIEFYRTIFNAAPYGMWPAEGSISEAAADAFAQSGIQWICGDMHVLDRSLPEDLDIARPYRLSTPSGDLMIVFRETNLSDHIGFTYQRMDPVEAADHFISEVMKFAPDENGADRLLTVILDGENAWEWYEYDMDGKQFLKELYGKLSMARAMRKLTCVTPTEYVQGNPARNIPPHPVSAMTEITDLWPGSWINANFDTWIGEPEENKAWEYLRQTREALASTGFPQPDPYSVIPEANPRRAIWLAYESIYAAEGSDWFWWFGADQTAGAGDRPFEEAFFSHLRSVYRHAIDAGAELTLPEFEPILSASKVLLQESGGAMSRSQESRKILFVCDASAQEVPVAVYIVGNQEALGNWTPNSVILYDDGTHGDVEAGDELWSRELEFPVGSEIQYKYTNSGEPGVWQPSEEFPQSNRAFTVEASTELQIQHAVFGER